MTNLKKFKDAYKISVNRALMKEGYEPLEIETLETLCDIIEHGDVDVYSFGMKDTCKALNIPHTHLEVFAFLGIQVPRWIIDELDLHKDEVPKKNLIQIGNKALDSLSKKSSKEKIKQIIKREIKKCLKKAN